MNPRTLSQIITELNPTFNPQIQALEQRAAQIPGQIASEEAGLQARQTEAFDNILSGARRRGTGIAFGGIPLGEQARYTATEYLPSLARLRQAGVEQRMSLQDAINQIRERRDTLAQNIYQTEQNRAESARQAAASRAAMASPSLGNLFGNRASSQQSFGMFDKLDDRGRTKQDAIAHFNRLQNSTDQNAYARELNAIYKSAQYGNMYDQALLELFNAANIYSGLQTNDLRSRGTI